ncbi:MAG: hypothetical protein ABR599_07020 [Gemmatimonadota bacterium]
MREEVALRTFRSGARPSALWVALALTFFGCSQPSEPLGDAAGEPNLAGRNRSCTAVADDPDPQIAPLICAQLTGGQRTAALSQYDNVRRSLARNNQAAALDQVLNLVTFVDVQVADAPPKVDLINRLLALVGIDPIDQSTLTDGIFALVDGAEGADLTCGNGLCNLSLPAGIWEGIRLVTSTPLDDDLDPLDTSVRQFPAYVLHRTDPDDVFLLQATVGHCAIFGADLTPPEAELTPAEISSLRLAKNLDPNDTVAPDGTLLPGGTAGGAEFFGLATANPLPGCPSSSPTFSTSAATAGGATSLQAGKGGAGSGLSLAGKSGPIGGAVSSFSPFGLVLPDDEGAATIEGIVFTDNDGIQTISGATVELYCDADTGPRSSPTATTTSGPEGEYSFDTDADGFAVGSDCFLFARYRESETAGGEYRGTEPPDAGSEGSTFDVLGGTNQKDIETFFEPDVFCVECDF